MCFRFFPKLILLPLLVFSTGVAISQTFLGGGFGTYNIPGAGKQFRGLCPTFKVEQVFDNQRITAYADLSYFSKEMQDGSIMIYDNSGNSMGSANSKTKYSYLYSQIGFKALLRGDADERKVLPYIGAGIALIRSLTKTSYASNIQIYEEREVNRFLSGFHFNTGAQYNFMPVILELRGNFDIILKPLVNDGTASSSNILTNLRLTALIPINK